MQHHVRFARRRLSDHTLVMRTIAEIKAAIEQLKPAEVAELAAWLEEYQQMINAASGIFAIFDRDEAQK